MEFFIVKKPVKTCISCVSFNPTNEDACSNLVTFRKPGTTFSSQPGPTDSCDDHEPRLAQIYKHPDSDSQISVEHINGEIYDHGVLIATDETGRTVRVPMGSIGLIEVGLALAGLGKKMVYA